MAQRYIPGLTPRPTEDMIPSPQASLPKEVPEELITSFVNSSKQPISALMEYSAMKKLTTTFKEVPVKNYSLTSKFANECAVNGIVYPQGTGKTKKAAKTKAAEIAFNIILGRDSFENHCEPTPPALQVSKPATRVSNTGEYEEPPKKKTAKKIFEEYCKVTDKKGWVDTGNEPGPFGFVARAYIVGREVGEETGKTKLAAINAVYESVVENLQLEDLIYQELTKEATEDMMAKACYKKLEELLSECSEYPDVQDAQHTFAAFIVRRGGKDPGEIVAMGTGNTCLSYEHLTYDGRTLIDSYAVAVARRALLKYFHKEAKAYLDGDKVMSIFCEREEEPGQLLLKDHISIHLFLSQPPCGDYRECLDMVKNIRESPCKGLTDQEESTLDSGIHYPVINDELPGWFCVKNEEGEVEAVEEDQAPIQEMATLTEGEELLLVMSCSDKLLQWNVLGLQGSHFSNFLKPIYLTSIVLGHDYHHGHMARAMCCRLYEIINSYLPQPYKLHHPILSTVTFAIEETLKRPTSKSINWSLGDKKVEIVNGYSGKVIENSPFRSSQNPGPCASRLCKAAFLSRYRDIGNALKNRDMLQTPNYISSKRRATDYQAAKLVFKKFSAKTGLGNWVQKPRELENFEK